MLTAPVRHAVSQRNVKADEKLGKMKKNAKVNNNKKPLKFTIMEPGSQSAV